MVAAKLSEMQAAIKKAAQRAAREESLPTLVAVSKRVAAERIRTAYEAGQQHFGESYVQEALPKIEALKDCDITWHAIGKLQTNKIKQMVRNFSWWHSLENERQLERLAKELDKAASDDAIKLKHILLQVNVASEANKGGVAANELTSMLEAIESLDAFDVCGLMAIPPKVEQAEENRQFYRAMRNMAATINAMHLKRVCVKHLSMGMSGDFEVAIEEGATLIRVGQALFGARA